MISTANFLAIDHLVGCFHVQAQLIRHEKHTDILPSTPANRALVRSLWDDFYTLHFLPAHNRFVVPILDAEPSASTSNVEPNMFRACPTLAMSLLTSPRGWEYLLDNGIIESRTTASSTDWKHFCLDRREYHDSTETIAQHRYVRLLYHLPGAYHKFARKLIEPRYERLLKFDAPRMYWNEEEFLVTFRDNEAVRTLTENVWRLSRSNKRIGCYEPIAVEDINSPKHVYRLLLERQNDFWQRRLAAFGKEPGAFVFEQTARGTGISSPFTSFFESVIEKFFLSKLSLSNPVDEPPLYREAVRYFHGTMGEMHEAPYRYHIHPNMHEDLLNLALGETVGE